MRIGNWPLVMLALEHIIKHADQYNQGNWRSDCGSIRCFGGWLAYFAGWRDVNQYSAEDPYFYGVNRTGRMEDGGMRPICEAALLSLELDPEFYGEDVNDFDMESEMQDLVDDLFASHRSFSDILFFVRDLMKADGVTPTPLIEKEMRQLGVLPESEPW